MTQQKHPFYTRSKIWIEDSDGNVVFGLGRLKILKAIQKQGSLNKAAKELKMSYRAIWARINATEDRLGQKLLIKRTGGSSGGGSELTPLAEALIKHFETVRVCVENNTDNLFERVMGEYLPIDNSQPAEKERDEK